MSSYERYIDYLKFPSGRSVRSARNDAQKLRKNSSESYTACLNKVAADNGASGNWDQSIELLLEQSIASHPHRQAEMSMDDLLDIARRNPKLTQYGVGMWGDIAKLRPWATYEEHLQSERESAYMLHSNCNLALAYTNQLKPQKKVNTDASLSSYELKHHVEQVFKQMGVDLYIHHGAFIFAALYKGFLPQRCAPESLSLFFNISPESPILKWSGDVNSPIVKLMKNHIRSVDPVRFADI